MNKNSKTTKNTDANGLNQTVTSETGQVCSLDYFCEMCEYYPLHPVHGHYECPQCGYKTKCCEGAPQE